MGDNIQNLRAFKIIYSQQYIQIIPLKNNLQTQILINKRTNHIHFENINKQYQFSGDFEIKFASLILGLAEIQSNSFLLYVQNVYLQPPFPPNNVGIYQIASINFVQYGRVVTNRERQIFNTMKTVNMMQCQQIFNFSFYFSFDRDLTLSFQKFKTKTENSKSREMYFWNYGMIKALMTSQTVSQWFIPIIQGHYGSFQLSIGNKDIKYYLLSRRSKYRSGTRFYNRGIDQNSKCSQFIETQQIFVVQNMLTSFISLSGSTPLFWQQKSQGDKIRLTRNKELTVLPLIDHFNQIKNDYGKVMVVNLLQRKKEGQNLLLQALEQLIFQNDETFSSFLRYIYLDINQIFRNKNYQEIFRLISHIDPIFKSLAYFQYDILQGTVLNIQSGVFRVSCLDCLARTNKFMQAIFYYMLSQHLFHEHITSEPTTNTKLKDLLFGQDSDISSLIFNFRNVWQEKADFESMIYTGSRAANGKKNKFLDDLQDSFISLQRLYNQKFLDQIKQKALDILLYHKNFRMTSMLKNKQNTELQISIISWNVNATDPQKMKQLNKIVAQCDESDLVVFGIQEMIQLNTNNVMTNNEEESINSIKWGKILQKILNERTDKKIFVQKVQMVGLLLIIFVSNDLKHSIRSVHKDSIKTGMGGQFGNKGAVVIRVKMFETSLCFVCAHLTAGFSKSKERLDDFIQIHKKAFQQSKIGVQNEVQIQMSDYKWFLGDLNFRINGEFKQIKELLQRSQQQPELKIQVVNKLLQSDQLCLNRKNPQAPYILANYEQNDISFLPTYKLDKNTGKYTQERNRNPSWCDRILYCFNNELDHICQCIQYSDINVIGSDHRPIIGKFRIVVNQSMRNSMLSH